MVESLHSYALVCLTSPNGVELLFEAMADRGLDARALANATMAAIGPGTARALRDRGVIADIVPPRSIAESLVESLREVDVNDRPVLIARAAEARDVLPDALAERGASVDVVPLYETVRDRRDEAAIEAAATPTTSPSPPPRPCATSPRRSATVPARARGRLDRPGDQRDGPRARPRRSPWKPTRTTPTASSRPCSQTRRPAHRLVWPRDGQCGID